MSVDQGKKVMVSVRSYIVETEKAIEKQTGKLLAIAKAIQALDKDGHTAFRAEIEMERQNLILAKINGALDVTDFQGYMSSSYPVMLANLKAISKACELGLSILRDDEKPKSWALLYKDAVKINQDAVQKAAEQRASTVQRPMPGDVVIGVPTVTIPTPKKVGRQATSLFDLALKACEQLRTNNPKEFQRLVTHLVRESKQIAADEANKAHASNMTVPPTAAPAPSTVM